MKQRAGLLFLSKNTKRIFLILENQKWTVPTFERNQSLLDDIAPLLDQYAKGRIIPVELYLSADRGFEYGTYVCLVGDEFLTRSASTLAWCDLNHLPKNLHTGLNLTLNSSIIRTKIDTIVELESYLEK
jgi:hypothetical protein